MIKDFLRFIRLETCLFISGIALSGYLLSGGSFGLTMLFLFLAFLFISAASYAFNNLKDKKEDSINSGLNPWVEWKYSPILVASFAILSAIFAFYLPFNAFLLFLFGISLSFIYSGFKVKRVTLLKNIWTGFTLALVFLTGMLCTGWKTDFLIYVPFAFLIGFKLNFLGDLRGYKGDKLSGIKTIPVVLGYEKAKLTAEMLLIFFIFSVLLLRLIGFYPLLPFIIAILFFLSEDEMKKTRISILSSFASLPLWLWLSRFMGEY